MAEDFLSQFGRPVDTAPPSQQPITNPKSPQELAATPQDNFLQQYGKPVIGPGSSDDKTKEPWTVSPLGNFGVGMQKAVGMMSPEGEEAYAKAPKGPNASISEKAGEGAAFGMPFGPAGALAGATSSGVTEAMHQRYPNDPYFMNEGLGILAGIAINPIAGAATQLATKAARTAPELFGIGQSPINKAYSDLGVTARVGGASSESAWPMQMQNALREGIGGSGIIRNQEDKIFSQIEQAAERQASRLAPDVTQQQLGEQVVNAAGQRGLQLKQWRENLYNALDAQVPRQQDITASNFDGALNSLLGRFQGAPELARQAQQSGINRYLTALQTDLAANNGTLPYSTLKNVRTDLGEQIQKGIMEPGTDVKELRALYSALTRDLEGAYSAGGLRAFRTVNAYAERTFDEMHTLVQPLLARGITPETIAQRMMSQINKGATRADDITTALNNADPTIKDTMLAYALRRLGEGPNGEFNPSRLWNNFNKLSPEFKALYPAEQQAGMNKLAEASGLIRDSFASRNTSGTTPTLHLLNQIGHVARGLTMTATGGLFGAGAHAMAQNGMMDAGAGAVGAGVGYAMSPIVEAVGNNLLARVWTSRVFNTFLGTQGLDKIPGHGTLGAVLAEEPNLLPFVDTVSQATQLKSGEKGRGFLSGGVVSPMQNFPDQGTAYLGGGAAGFPLPNMQGYAEGGAIGDDYNTKLTPEEELKFQMWKLQNAPRDFGFNYDLRGAFKAGLNPASNGHWSDEFKKPNHETFSNESKYSRENPQLPAGSWQGEHFFPPANYAEGGSVGPLISANSNNPPMNNVRKLHSSGWDQLGVAMPFQNSSIIDQLMPSIFTVAKPTNDFNQGGMVNTSILNYALGGLTNTRMPPDDYPPGYAQGGIADEGSDPRPFYNFNDEEGWSQGFAEGGLSTSEIGYAEGGLSTDKLNASRDASGAANDKFKQAVDYLSSKTGVDPEVMKGAVKYMYKNESGLDENIINPTSKAHGMGQWLGSRKTDLFSQYGPKQTYQNQLDFIAHELLTGKDGGGTLAKLKAAQGEKAGYDIWGRHFERPGDAALAKAGANYKPGDITVANSTNPNSKLDVNKAVEPQSVIDQFLNEQEEMSKEDPEVAANKPIIETLNAAPWVNPETKFSATKILSGDS